jgi:hypothetical protein
MDSEDLFVQEFELIKFGVLQFIVIFSLISVIGLSSFSDALVIISGFMFDEGLCAQQVLLYVMVPLVLGFPLDAFHGQTRLFFLKTLVRLTFPIQVCFPTRERETDMTRKALTYGSS